jgi:hypothetical protein
MASPENFFYVSPSGSDSNPGTYSRPWRTIQKAANTLVAGQTVKILPGTYNAKFAPVNSGSANGYITYTADPGTVILDGTGVPISDDSKGDGLVQIQGKSYIRVQNLSLRDSSKNCVNISRNLAGTMRSSYIELTGLNIQNCNEAGILAFRGSRSHQGQYYQPHILLLGYWVVQRHHRRSQHNHQRARTTSARVHEEVLTIAGLITSCKE